MLYILKPYGFKNIVVTGEIYIMENQNTNANSGTARFCKSCGSPNPLQTVVPAQPAQNTIYIQQSSAPSNPTSGLAIASMVLGILSLVVSCFGVVGIICGILAVLYLLKKAEKEWL